MWWLNTDGYPDCPPPYPYTWPSVYSPPLPPPNQAPWLASLTPVWRVGFREKGKMYPTAPASSYSAQGAGGNYVWVDPRLELVVVARWCDDFAGLIERIMAAMLPQTKL